MRRNRCHDKGRFAGEPTVDYDLVPCHPGNEMRDAPRDLTTQIPSCIKVSCVNQLSVPTHLNKYVLEDTGRQRHAQRYEK